MSPAGYQAALPRNSGQPYSGFIRGVSRTVRDNHREGGVVLMSEDDYESLVETLEILSAIIGRDPYAGKKLVGELAGSYSFRLTYQDRIVYSIDSQKKIIYIERAKTHYGE